ncbi:immunoglobulin alpha-2 heavy chain-like [Hoplias malabaricus]|uniref:immunoglobulin alpha-2 heavy chain-like n=1 Tax=Hoplias malabaricus TaxID=27720 RepID=UPI0034627AFC
MIQIYFTLVLSTALGGASKIDVPCVDGLQYIQSGDNITLNCSFDGAIMTVWFKQTPGEKLLLVASAFRSTGVKYHSGFQKSGRFKALREQSAFTLNITSTEPSDSATYYCAAADYSDTVLLGCTILILKGSSSSHYTVSQANELDRAEAGGNRTLQCSVLTDASAGEHSVYWLRHGSGESPPGVIYTHGDTNSQCSSSSETDSPTQSCVYKLPKTNLSLSDAGNYYCAVAVCGQILFGNGTKLDFVENGVSDPVIIVLAASNIISLVMVLFLCRKLHSSHHKDGAKGHTVQVNQVEDTGEMNYAALNFAQASSSRRVRVKNISDQPVYAQVKNLQ